MPGSVRLRLWLGAARAPFLPASLMSVGLSCAVAVSQSRAFDWPGLGIVALGVAALHLGVNLLNDYWDHVGGSDQANDQRTPFNGGSGYIQSGRLEPNQVRRAAMLLIGAAGLAGVWLALRSGPAIWVLMAIGFLLGVGYSAPPLSLMGSGWGEGAAGLCCGPLVALGAYHVLAGQFSWSAVWPAAPVGLLVSAILVINEVPDQAADTAVGKRNLVVRRGRRAGVALHSSLVLVAYGWVIGYVALGLLPRPTLAVLMTAPLAWAALRAASSGTGLRGGYAGASAKTVGLHSLFALVLVGSYLV